MHKLNICARILVALAVILVSFNAMAARVCYADVGNTQFQGCGRGNNDLRASFPSGVSTISDKEYEEYNARIAKGLAVCKENVPSYTTHQCLEIAYILGR
ncbi:hypothetical protein [Burkholderia cepacia]|uniref:hypothetical protein n=1 Tax=Burkholderia cepacia TaxID=292 RepID=UPI0011B290AD|nr:hypothetical protein [Burkholderia cepacia]